MALNPVTRTPVMPGTQSAGPGETLAKDDFLKVLVAQMQHMDPMAAGDGDNGQQMIGQMTQFSMLEQISNLAKASERSSTLALIGRNVTWKGTDGAEIQGLVESVDSNGGKLTLTVNGQQGVDPAAVTAVR